MVGADGEGVVPAERGREAWWARVAWQPQRPTLVAGTLRENAELFGADPDRLDEAARASGFDAVLAARPEGCESTVGYAGAGLSRGEAHRLALTRALASGADVLVLDEPTEHLGADDAGELLRRICAPGGGAGGGAGGGLLARTARSWW